MQNQPQPDDYQYEYMSHAFQRSSNSNSNSVFALPNVISNPIMINNQPKLSRPLGKQDTLISPALTHNDHSLQRNIHPKTSENYLYYSNTPVKFNSRCTSLNYQNLNEQISYQPNEPNNYKIYCSNENYSQIIPILKQKQPQQQPVSLHMVNAANAASQAAENYMNFKRVYSSNQNYMQHRIISRLNGHDKKNYFYYLSNTLPNLFEPDMSENPNYLNYENSNKTDQQRLHRINKRLDYETSASCRNTCTYDYMPVTKFLEESNDEQWSNGRVSRSLEPKKTFKRTTSV